MPRTLNKLTKKSFREFIKFSKAMGDFKCEEIYFHQGIFPHMFSIIIDTKEYSFEVNFYCDLIKVKGTSDEYTVSEILERKNPKLVAEYLKQDLQKTDDIFVSKYPEIVEGCVRLDYNDGVYLKRQCPYFEIDKNEHEQSSGVCKKYKVSDKKDFTIMWDGVSFCGLNEGLEAPYKERKC